MVNPRTQAVFLGFLFQCQGLILSQVLVTDGCPACVLVDPLPGPGPDDLAGVYNYQGESEDCPGGCSYYGEDDPLTPYCFGPGERTGNLQCEATTIGESEGSSPGLVTMFSSQTSEDSSPDISTQDYGSTGGSVSIVTTLEGKTTRLSSSDSTIVFETTIDTLTTIAGSSLGSSIPESSESQLSTSGGSTADPSTTGDSMTSGSTAFGTAEGSTQEITISASNTVAETTNGVVSTEPTDFANTDSSTVLPSTILTS